MKQDRRSSSVSDRTFSWVMRLGVMVLAIGVGTFGFMYYQDQHVNAGPSLVDRQITGAEAAVKKAPNSLAIRLQLAASYLLNKRPDDALKQYDVILKANKGNRQALLGRGHILIDKGDLKAAAVAYHQITDLAAKGEFSGADPQAQEAHYYLGQIAVKQGNTKVAISELQIALRMDSTDSDALYLLGLARLKEGSTKLAIDSFKQALQFVPMGWCEPYTQLNVAYGKLGNAPEATYAGAMASFCHKKTVEAKRQLNTLTTGPVKIDALLGLGLIAETESNNPAAISSYKTVLTLDPKNASAISNLSRLGVAPTSTTKK
jgi:tetratricopeptide (TPR) repeat protein